jgi:hypothetical protein
MSSPDITFPNDWQLRAGAQSARSVIPGCSPILTGSIALDKRVHPDAPQKSNSRTQSFRFVYMERMLAINLQYGLQFKHITSHNSILANRTFIYEGELS